MFSDKQRAIFTVEGDPPRRYDPLAVRRRLLAAANGDLYTLVQAAADPEGGAKAAEPPDQVVRRMQAQEQLLAAVREAFDLPPFDAEGGFTDAMTWHVWNTFNGWLEKNA